MKVKLEYIWLDGYKPEPNLRSKTKVIDLDDDNPVLNTTDVPKWNFDGSSTKQAEGNNSDCVLNPVRVVRDPQRPKSFLVMCEVLNPDGTPHSTNKRSLIKDKSTENWFGFEQEYTIMKDGKPLGFPDKGFPDPQGRYYCGVGGEIIEGRKIAEEHLDVCIMAGLDVTGINAEVMLGQWEYQLFGKGAQVASDDLWLSRFLLNRIAEIHEVSISVHPKPVEGDWNGSGMHCNFSNKDMREIGGKEMLEGICDTFGFYHEEHINVYGSDNEKRLTGQHETQHIDKFSYGVSDRGASIRIPTNVVSNDWKGYLEDRRPSSNADPYKITNRILETLEITKHTEEVE
tara:strand:+ start:64 stop:1092 length:1029 start_codon:yes stop_codon:yes gene_type:complete